MSKAKYCDKSIADWNVNDFHAYLIETTTEKFGVTYVPFGYGPVSKKWAAEKGQLKNAQKKYGNEVLYYWIKLCLETYRPTAQYPFTPFGFMNAYQQDKIALVQKTMESAKRNAEEIRRQLKENDETGDDWF